MRRLTMLVNAPTFNNSTNAVDRSAGFSDSWYQVPGDSFLITPSDTDLINKRAALLPRTSTIVGARISDVDQYGRTTGKTRTYKMAIPGGQNIECDDPRVSLIYECDGVGKANEFSLFIQNVPDIRVVKGTYNPAGTWSTPLQAYFASLYAGNYGFFGYNLTYPKFSIQSITTDPLTGVTTLLSTQDVSSLAGFYVRMLRTSAFSTYKPNPNGYGAAAGPTVNKLILNGWTHGNSAGGLVTLWGKNFCNPTFTAYTIANPQAGTRKVGRPFFQYRGRSSKRRK